MIRLQVDGPNDSDSDEDDDDDDDLNELSHDDDAEDKPQVRLKAYLDEPFLLRCTA